MEKLRKAIRLFADFFEIILPEAVFLLLFGSFILNILFRYVIKFPLNWTYEVSTQSFVILCFLASCIAFRLEDHVVFDLVYAGLKPKAQNIFRMISNLIIFVCLVILAPIAIQYLWKIRAELTSILRVPLYFIFGAFPVMVISIFLRALHRLILDIKAFTNKTYVQLYNTEQKETLI